MITSVLLSSFRRYRDVSLPLDSFTLITGMNGSGKTHILEALHWVCGGTIGPNLLGGDESVNISGEGKALPFQARIERTEGKVAVSFQGKKVSKPKYLDVLPIRTVMFSPFDMNLMYLSPSLRREYMDSLLERSFAQFGATKRQYEAVLRQRNALLKSLRENGGSHHDLDFWDEKFASLAEIYLLYRERYIMAVMERITEVTRYFPDYTLEFQYVTKVERADPKTFILEYLREKRERDILAGHTYIGPHLDDFTWNIALNGQFLPVSEYLSRGENKMILLGMKYIEVDFLRQSTEKEIILLFDDMFAELDSHHADGILKRFSHLQMCITAQYIPDFLRGREHFSCIETENL